MSTVFIPTVLRPNVGGAKTLDLGGETIREFLIVMLIGLVSGTYSSIFVASQLLISWEHGELPLISRRRRREVAEAV